MIQRLALSPDISRVLIEICCKSCNPVCSTDVSVVAINTVKTLLICLLSFHTGADGSVFIIFRGCFEDGPCFL